MVPSQDCVALRRFETRLREAASAYGASLAGSEIAPRWLLMRYGIASAPAVLDGDERRALADRLRIEDRRLLRAARAGRPGYDLGRHLALRRLACRLEAPDCPPTERAPSGAELNARFVRRGRPEGYRGPARPASGPAR